MLNAAVLVAGIGVLNAPSIATAIAIALFAIGVAVAITSVAATRVQHAYYRGTRDLKRRVEDRLGLDELAISPTPGMGASQPRLAKIQTFQQLILALLCVADGAGLVTAVVEALS